MRKQIFWPKNKRVKYLIGIDEAGRGPLAGPVSVAAVCLKKPLGRTWLVGLKDSKGLSETRREVWFAKIKDAQTAGELTFAVSLVSATVIDRLGIVSAIRLATRRTLRKLISPRRRLGERRLGETLGKRALQPNKCKVLLDGSLSCDLEYQNQTTIIRGDQTEPLIALASIVAKVRRDNLMKRLAKQYPVYQFEIHKGYGTALHRRKIKKHGPSLIHRRSFLHRILGRKMKIYYGKSPK